MSAMDYWHGGRRGIAVGEYIRSPHERRHEWSRMERQLEMYAEKLGYNDERDPKRVYLTTDRELARGWAMNRTLRMEGGGALYRVRPVPPSSLEVDPDYAASGFSARRALVLEVAEALVQMPEEEATRAICKYSLWTDDSRMYDDDGYMLPPPEHRALGAVPQQYRHLGRWFRVVPGHAMVLLDGQVFMAPRSSAPSARSGVEMR